MNATGDKTVVNGGLKFSNEYINYPEKEVKAFCRKIGVCAEQETMDIVKNIMWVGDNLIENANKIKSKPINIYIQSVVDPDSLASARCLGELLRMQGTGDFRILGGKVGHPQNIHMMEECGIVMFNANDARFENALNCVVDTSPPLGARNTVMVDNPPKNFFLVCDHHNSQEDIFELCKSSGVKSLLYPIIGKRVGATSTIIAVLAMYLKQLDNLMSETLAAILFGIYSDTSGLVHNVTKLDLAVFNKINKDRVSEIFMGIQNYEYPDEWLTLKHRAYKNQMSEGKIRLTTTGLTPDSCRDVIAECANDILRIKNTVMSFCLAITMQGLDLSVRADSRLLRLEPQRIVDIVDTMFKELFPGKSGFKYTNLYPHRIEGGACVKLEAIDQIFLDIKDGKPDYNDPQVREKSWVRCSQYIESIIKVIKKMAANDPELMSGLNIVDENRK